MLLHHQPGRAALGPLHQGPCLHNVVAAPRLSRRRRVCAAAAAVAPASAEEEKGLQGQRAARLQGVQAQGASSPPEEPLSEEELFPVVQLSLPTATHAKVKTSKYISSTVNHKQCPPPKYPEFAVIGRSNVGKSSLINMLTGSKRLAHVSKEPGKTRCINHFLINDSWYMVDLPGYGFAKTNFEARSAFDRFTKDYFKSRPNLAMVYLLIDGSVPPQKVDLEYATWLLDAEIPFVIVFTKADKRKKAAPGQDENTTAFKRALLQECGFAALPPSIATSSEMGMGKSELLHLTAALRVAFEKSGRLEEAMLAWQREKIYGPGGMPGTGDAGTATGSMASAGSMDGAGQQGAASAGQQQGPPLGAPAGPAGPGQQGSGPLPQPSKPTKSARRQAIGGSGPGAGASKGGGGRPGRAGTRPRSGA